jgi:fructose-1,6-bisphosphatase I
LQPINNSQNEVQIESRLKTIDQHINLEEALHPEATGEFSLLLHDLTFAIKLIAKEVRRAGLNNILGSTNQVNIHGEKIQRLDEYANNAINLSLLNGGHVCAMASEESEEIIRINKKNKQAKYVIVFDPIDGSTNIDVNITIGTIFSIYQRVNPKSDEMANVEDVLQSGSKQLAAGYALYGSSTLLVYTTGNGVYVFTYDPEVGEFFLTFDNITIPKRGYFYSCNEGNYYKWDKIIQQYITFLKSPYDKMTKPYTLRYVASVVADLHRTLHYGGIYLYPADYFQPQGKIRLVYEANPLAMIIEQAGGIATTGSGRILDLKPETVHQRIPFFAGSPENVNEIEQFIRGEHIFLHVER